MPKEYICEFCKKQFSQKIDYTRHKNKKTACITITEMENIMQINENKVNLLAALKSCLNILRDNEAIVGDKALRNISYLLILKLIEPHIGTEINFSDHEYDFTHVEDVDINEYKNKLLLLTKFSNLANEKEENLPISIKYLWNDILSIHPATKHIFLPNKEFDIQKQSTFKQLILKINNLKLSHTDYDILGGAYEEVIQHVMTGKTLGQYFTPPSIKKMMIKLIDPQIKSDGSIETCCDPTMGTGGFLITYLRNILEKAANQNIKPDWHFIKTQGLYGVEIEPDTYQLALSNMLISSGHMFNNLIRGDSIRMPITEKFDNVMANPPFGIKGFNYDEIVSDIKLKYIPIKSNNAISLFLQAIIYMLKVNGKCAVVLPNGKDLSSTNNLSLIHVREYLLKTCEVKEIIRISSNTFTNTKIETCIFYFIKKVECSDVLKVEVKNNKYSYKCTSEYQTSSIKYYNYDTTTETKTFITEISIDNIKKNKHSLYCDDYLTEQLSFGNTKVKTLAELCNFLPKSKRNAKYGKESGLYPFFKSSMKIDSYVDEPDYKEESLIIGDGGEPNVNYGTKFSTSDHCYILQNKDASIVHIKYIYLYLCTNLEIMRKLYTGVGIKNISKTNIQKIQIPVPSLEEQEKIINYLESNKDEIKKLEQELKQKIEHYKVQAKVFINTKINQS